MEPTEAERRMRQRFGPPAGNGASLEPRRGRRPGRRMVVAGLLVALVLALAAVAWVVTPTQHAASGCFWWTAQTVGDVVSGGKGCLRGYVRVGGSIAEGPGAADYGLSYNEVGHRCRFRPGDAVVIRYHAIFDDGRTIVEIDDCS